MNQFNTFSQHVYLLANFGTAYYCRLGCKEQSQELMS
uniref:Uncharacterized protein n=1 Tax=Arundo donax TaxID=35708 RepID=A0A0A9R0Z4_ARUDO